MVNLLYSAGSCTVVCLEARPELKLDVPAALDLRKFPNFRPLENQGRPCLLFVLAVGCVHVWKCW